MQPMRRPALPALRMLHERHPGFYLPLCETYADAAAICLADSHTAPLDIEIRCEQELSVREIDWDEPSERAIASWANRDDTTRDGAYSVSLATVEAELGFVAIRRAETRTGADYYVGSPGTDLEGAHRLETSGVRFGDLRDVNSRLREKIEQTKRGSSDRPALACVVGFAAKTVALAIVGRNDES